MIESVEERGDSDPAAIDADRFAELYRGLRPGLIRTAALTLGSTALADDIVQDAFAALYRSTDEVHVPAAWLRTAVVRACLNERRRGDTARRYRHQVSTPAVSDGGIPLLSIDDPIIAALRGLPVRQRTAVVLRYYDDLSEAEIAEAMDISAGTVKSTIHRALKALRKEIDHV